MCDEIVFDFYTGLQVNTYSPTVQTNHVILQPASCIFILLLPEKQTVIGLSNKLSTEAFHGIALVSSPDPTLSRGVTFLGLAHTFATV